MALRQSEPHYRRWSDARRQAENQESESGYGPGVDLLVKLSPFAQSEGIAHRFVIGPASLVTQVANRIQRVLHAVSQ